MEFQVETVGVGALPEVWEVTSEGVTGGAPPNPARRGKSGVGAGGQGGSQRRQAQDLQDCVSCKGRT